jgi:hypothetical protein
MGERDGWRQRYPQHEQDPMISRLPGKSRETVRLEPEEEKVESPWRVMIHGTQPLSPP